MSKPDTLHITCPECNSFVPITVYNGLNEGIDFCLEEAPLSIVSEANEASRDEEVQCMSCGLHIAIVVRFMAYEVPLNNKTRFCR